MKLHFLLPDLIRIFQQDSGLWGRKGYIVLYFFEGRWQRLGGGGGAAFGGMTSAMNQAADSGEVPEVRNCA
jgi:hypothetical protein